MLNSLRIPPLHGFGSEGRVRSFQDAFYLLPFGKTSGISQMGFFPSLLIGYCQRNSFPLPLAATLLMGTAEYRCIFHLLFCYLALYLRSSLMI